MESNELLKALESLKHDLMNIKSASEQVEEVVEAQKCFAKGTEAQSAALQRSIDSVVQIASKLETVGAMVQDEYLPALERIAEAHLSGAGQKVITASESLKHTREEVANLVQAQKQLLKQTQDSSFGKRLEALEALVSKGQKQTGEQLQQQAKQQQQATEVLLTKRLEALDKLVDKGQKQTEAQLRQQAEQQQARGARLVQRLEALDKLVAVSQTRIEKLMEQLRQQAEQQQARETRLAQRLEALEKLVSISQTRIDLISTELYSLKEGQETLKYIGIGVIVLAVLILLMVFMR